MEIRELVWDPINRVKLRRHGIEQWEVDSMLVADDWVVTTDEEYPDQVRMIGPTTTRRMLTVALEPTNEPTVWRPVTGWEADESEREYHWEETQLSR